MRKKTRRTLFQKLDCLSVWLNLPGCSETALFEDILESCRNLFIGRWLIKYMLCVCEKLLKNNQIVSLTTQSFSNKSDMCEIKTVPVLVALFVAGNFGIYTVHTEKKWDNQVKTILKILVKMSTVVFVWTANTFISWKTTWQALTALGLTGENDAKKFLWRN